jgi:hypothetical protein
VKWEIGAQLTEQAGKSAIVTAKAAEEKRDRMTVADVNFMIACRWLLSRN